MNSLKYQMHEVPRGYLDKWQKTVNLLANVLKVPAALIMRVWPDEIEVLISSFSDGNPYKQQEKAELETGLYCETVMATRKQLFVENALEDPDWNHNPDIELNMINYLGIPLIWPDNTIFGTMCVLDSTPRAYSKKYRDLLWQMKDIVESDFKVFHYSDKLEKSRSDLEQQVARRTEELNQSNSKLLYELSERKQKEKKLVNLVTAIEQAGESIVVTDRYGKIQYVNPSFEQTSGYSSEQVLGKKPKMLQSGKHDDAFYNKMWETLESGKIWHGGFINRKKDGTIFEEEATISPVLDKEGVITNYVAVKRDVTEQIKLRKQLNQAQKMEALGTLAGGIAHDFNNILTSILGYADMVLSELPENSDLWSKQEQVLKAANRAKELVTQILAFSRQTEEKKIPVEIHAVVKEAIKLLRSTIPSTVEIREKLDPRAGIILADPTQLHQIIMNLCTNADYAMRGTGGILAISLSTCQIDDTDINPGEASLIPGSYVKLEISDTGCGIDSETMKNIFDPYFTTKKRGEGTGLGLSTVHGIVESYKGYISVYSEQGKGTTFNIYLPKIAVPQKDKSRDRGKTPYPSGKESILIVDDEKSIVEMEKLMLESLGYKVFAYTNSNELLKKFKTSPQDFDLVITDMTMPEMTGTDLSRQILALRKDMPIIICTGFSLLINEEKAKAAGIKKFLMKPIVKKDLAREVRKILDGVSSNDFEQL